MSTIIIATNDLSICDTANLDSTDIHEVPKSGPQPVKDNLFELCTELAKAQVSAKAFTKTGKLKKLYREKAETILHGEDGKRRPVWAAPDNLHCIDTWKKFDPENKFLLVYESPQNLIANAFRNRLSPAQIKDQLASWVEYHDAMLKAYKKNKSDCMLLSNESYSVSGTEVTKIIQKRFKVPGFRIEGEEMPDTSKYVPLMALISRMGIPGEKAAFKLWEKLENESCVDSDPLWKLSDFDLMTELFSECKTLQASNQTLLEQHAEEKNLLNDMASEAREEMRYSFLAVPVDKAPESKTAVFEKTDVEPPNSKTKEKFFRPSTRKKTVAVSEPEQRRSNIKVFGYEVGKNFEQVQCNMKLLKSKDREFHDLLFQIQKLNSGYFLKLRPKNIDFLETDDDFVMYAVSNLRKTISEMPYTGKKAALKSLLTNIDAFLTKPENEEYVTEPAQMLVQDAHIEYVKSWSLLQRLWNRK